MGKPQSEKDVLVWLKAAVAVNAHQEVLAALLSLATCYIERGWTQEGADILAYLLHHEPDAELREGAQDAWDDLARWICPRVLLDAEDFGSKATLDDLIEYALA